MIVNGTISRIEGNTYYVSYQNGSGNKEISFEYKDRKIHRPEIDERVSCLLISSGKSDEVFGVMKFGKADSHFGRTYFYLERDRRDLAKLLDQSEIEFARNAFDKEADRLRTEYLKQQEQLRQV